MRRLSDVVIVVDGSRDQNMVAHTEIPPQVSPEKLLNVAGCSGRGSTSVSSKGDEVLCKKVR